MALVNGGGGGGEGWGLVNWFPCPFHPCFN